jgi:hypothetical protein
MGGLELTSTPRRSESNKHVLLASNLLLERRVVQHLNVAGSGFLRLGFHASLLLHESSQALEIAAALIVLDFAIREPLQRREALHAVLAAELFVGVGIDFGDGHFVRVLESAGELLVDGREGLAMPAPGGEELDESGFARVEDDVVEVVGEQVLDCRGGGGAGDGERRGEELGDADHCCCLFRFGKLGGVVSVYHVSWRVFY